MYYNTRRPHQGYRNMGRRPIDTINPFVNMQIKKINYTPDVCPVSG
jgi:hypothetical protein